MNSYRNRSKKKKVPSSWERAGDISTMKMNNRVEEKNPIKDGSSVKRTNFSSA